MKPTDKAILGMVSESPGRNGYLLVLDVGNPRTPILWASAGIDITAGLQAAFKAAPAR